MSNTFQLDSVSLSNFVQFNYLQKEYSSREEYEKKRQISFPGTCRRSFLVRVFLLEAWDWSKCRGSSDWLASDVAEW